VSQYFLEKPPKLVSFYIKDGPPIIKHPRNDMKEKTEESHTADMSLK
jgi:hypothetical protein